MSANHVNPDLRRTEMGVSLVFHGCQSSSMIRERCYLQESGWEWWYRIDGIFLFSVQPPLHTYAYIKSYHPQTQKLKKKHFPKTPWEECKTCTLCKVLGLYDSSVLRYYLFIGGSDLEFQFQVLPCLYYLNIYICRTYRVFTYSQTFCLLRD